MIFLVVVAVVLYALYSGKVSLPGIKTTGTPRTVDPLNIGVLPTSYQKMPVTPMTPLLQSGLSGAAAAANAVAQNKANITSSGGDKGGGGLSMGGGSTAYGSSAGVGKPAGSMSAFNYCQCSCAREKCFLKNFNYCADQPPDQGLCLLNLPDSVPRPPTCQSNGNCGAGFGAGFGPCLFAPDPCSGLQGCCGLVAGYNGPSPMPCCDSGGGCAGGGGCYYCCTWGC